MITLTVQLTQKELAKLEEALHGYQDEGPCCGEGWSSPELDSLTKKILEAASPTAEATGSNSVQ